MEAIYNICYNFSKQKSTVCCTQGLYNHSVCLFLKLQIFFCVLQAHCLVLAIFLCGMNTCLVLHVFLYSTDILFLILMSLPWSSHRPTSEKTIFFHSALKICYTILVLKIMPKVRIFFFLLLLLPRFRPDGESQPHIFFMRLESIKFFLPNWLLAWRKQVFSGRVAPFKLLDRLDSTACPQ